VSHRQRYADAVRDWARNSAASRYALSPEGGGRPLAAAAARRRPGSGPFRACRVSVDSRPARRRHHPLSRGTSSPARQLDVQTPGVVADQRRDAARPASTFAAVARSWRCGIVAFRVRFRARP
jgi:hypothetical protein